MEEMKKTSLYSKISMCHWCIITSLKRDFSDKISWTRTIPQLWMKMPVGTALLPNGPCYRIALLHGHTSFLGAVFSHYQGHHGQINPNPAWKPLRFPLMLVCSYACPRHGCQQDHQAGSRTGLQFRTTPPNQPASQLTNRDCELLIPSSAAHLRLQLFIIVIRGLHRTSFSKVTCGCPPTRIYKVGLNCTRPAEQKRA